MKGSYDEPTVLSDLLAGYRASKMKKTLKQLGFYIATVYRE